MRNWNPNHVYFVTNNCEQNRLFLLPRPRLDALIGAWMAKALAEHGHGIELYAFVFLPDRFHLLLRDPQGELASFMWFFQLNLAKAVNRELHRGGHFFAREYDAAAVLTEADLDERYAFVLTAGVEAGLVAKASEGSFFSSLEMARQEKGRGFEWEDRTLRHNKSRRGKKVSREEVTSRYELALTLPGWWKEKTREARRSRVERMVRANEARCGRRRKSQGLEVIGPRRLRAMSPLSRLKGYTRPPRVRAYCADAGLAKRFLEWVIDTTARYREALVRFRWAAACGRPWRGQWPPWTYAPSTMTPVPAR